MKTTTELRASTVSNFCIFLDGIELPTRKEGAINSAGGIVLKATLPTGEAIKWRSNDNYGRKGFSFDTLVVRAQDDKALPKELRARLEYKIS